MNILKSCKKTPLTVNNTFFTFLHSSFDTPSSALSRDSRHKLKTKNGCQKFLFCSQPQKKPTGGASLNLYLADRDAFAQHKDVTN